MTAVAIFVKTPGLSPVKTRLAQAIGTANAERFHRLAAAAVASVLRACQPGIVPYWAVAEPNAHWPGFPTIHQGEGGLGARMRSVYDHLLARHGSVLLTGADIPQVTRQLFEQAAAILTRQTAPYVVGPAQDGGFWLFGGRRPVPDHVWTETPYSRPDTGALFEQALCPSGAIAHLDTLTDADSAADLPKVLAALRSLVHATPEQTALADWLGHQTTETP